MKKAHQPQAGVVYAVSSVPCCLCCVVYAARTRVASGCLQGSEHVGADVVVVQNLKPCAAAQAIVGKYNASTGHTCS